MKKHPRIQQLAYEAALQIKVLTVAHQTQIEAVYRQFRQQAAAIIEDNADSLDGSSATPTQSTEIDRSNNPL